MISYQQLTLQLLQQAEKLQRATTDTETREGLAAIRALCDLGLGQPAQQAPTASPAFSNNGPIAVTPVHTPNSPTSAVPLEGDRLKDDDANGDSLFDF